MTRRTELTVIAKDINHTHELAISSHESAISSARTAIEHAHRIGDLLTEAKQYVQHGQWETWLANNCPFSERTAQKYMQLSKAPLAADLGIEETLALMAEPKESRPEELKPVNEKDMTVTWMPDNEQMTLQEAIEKFLFQQSVFYEQMKNSSEKVRIAMYEDACHRGRINIIAFEMAAGRFDDGKKSEYGLTMKNIHEYYCWKGAPTTEKFIADMAQSIPAKYHNLAEATL